jgi:hypothetical protein
MKILAALIMLTCSVAPCCAYNDEPTIYLQPHGPIETRMILWRLDKPRRTVKRGVISGAVLDVVSNVLVICLRRGR